MRKNFLVTGSVVSALLSSVCCIGPLLILSFGVSGAGWLPFLKKYRLLFVAGAVGFLIWNWVRLFQKRCCVDKSSLKKGIITNLISSLIVAAVILLPYVLKF